MVPLQYAKLYTVDFLILSAHFVHTYDFLADVFSCDLTIACFFAAVLHSGH